MGIYLLRLFPLLLVVLLAVGLLQSAPVAADGEASAGVPAFTLTRNEFGVPHIEADSDAGLFYGFGYAIAQDRLTQLELYRRTARGTMAEAFGKTLLAADQLERRENYTDEEYELLFESLPAEGQAMLMAYRDGINAYLVEVAADPDNLLPWELSVAGIAPEPWTVTDSLAIMRFMVRRFGEVGGNDELLNQAAMQTLIEAHGEAQGLLIYNDLHWLNDSKAPVTVPNEGTTSSSLLQAPAAFLPGVSAIADLYQEEQALRLEMWETYGIPPKFGSYTWAVSPARSANGSAMLYGGPQMGFTFPDIMHEVQLSGGDDDQWHVYGMAFAGGPLVLIGQNLDLAWSSTTGAGDTMDIVVEQLNPENANQYWYNGAWQEMELRVEQIPVLVGVGVTTTVPYTIARTVHGPVIALDGENNLAYSEQRQHWLKESNSWWAFYHFNLASSVEEFAVGVDLFETTNNFMLATAAGDIAYWQAGKIPQRADGLYVGRFPWLGDGSSEWSGEIRALPSALNPAQGYLANWNNKPEANADNGDDQNLGTQNRLLDLLDLLDADESISRAEMNEIAVQIGVVGILGKEERFVLAPMIEAVRNDAPNEMRLQEAADMLEAWDGYYATSPISSTTYVAEYSLFSTWLDRTLHNTFNDEFGDLVERVNINHLIHAIEGEAAGVPPTLDYFDIQDTDFDETASLMFITSLVETLALLEAEFGTDEMSQWLAPRGEITFEHPILGAVGDAIPLSNRSTYGLIAVANHSEPSQAIIPSGQSGFLGTASTGFPFFGEHTLDQRALFEVWQYKTFNLKSAPTSIAFNALERQTQPNGLFWLPALAMLGLVLGVGLWRRKQRAVKQTNCLRVGSRK